MDGSNSGGLKTSSAVGGDPLSDDLWPDEALADALSLVVDKMRAEWEREKALMVAEARAVVAQAGVVIAELRSQVGELQVSLRQRVDEEQDRVRAALVLVKDGAPGVDGQSVDLAELDRMVEQRVTEKVAGALAAVAELQETVKSFPVPQDGRTPGNEELTPLVEEAVQRRWDAMPVPKDGEPGPPGQSVTIEEVVPVIRQAAAEEVAALPLSQMVAEEVDKTNQASLHNGTLGEVKRLNSAVAGMDEPLQQAREAAAVIAAWEPPKVEDFADIVTSAVAAEVAKAIPVVLAPDDVRNIAGAVFEEAIKALPTPQDGHTPTEDEILPVVELVVQRLVEAIPVPKDGEPGAPGRDGESGKDAEPLTAEQVAEAILAHPEMLAVPVHEYLEANPPSAGEGGEPGPPGRDGKDAEPITREQLVEAILTAPEAILHEAIEEHLTKCPPPPGRDGRDGVDGKSGAGIRELLIDREGKLIVTRDDGSTVNLGMAIGKDGRDGQDGVSVDAAEVDAMIDRKFQTLPVPKDGRDGKDAEPVEIFAPEEVGVKVSKAIGALAEMPPIYTPPSAPGSANKTITMTRDADGNLIAAVKGE